MTRRISWLLVAFVLLSVAGCAAETLPELPEAEATGAATPGLSEPEMDTPAFEEAETEPAAAEPQATSTATATATVVLEEDMTEAEPAATGRPYASPTPHPEEVATLELELNPVKPGPEQSQRTNFAKNDLAGRLGVDVADIEVTAYETVTWSDGSLGCPQPGMMYTQALVDGYLIQLMVDGQTYNYHGANGRDPFLCVKDGDESTGPSRGGFQATPPPSSEDV
jgi:predicted small lipoprotein YifL